MKKTFFLLVLYLVLVLGISFQHDARAQCSMCRTQTKSSLAQEDEQARAKGVNNGILYLMLVPYIGIGCLAIAWYWKKKQATREA